MFHLSNNFDQFQYSTKLWLNSTFGSCPCRKCKLRGNKITSTLKTGAKYINDMAQQWQSQKPEQRTSYSLDKDLMLMETRNVDQPNQPKSKTNFSYYMLPVFTVVGLFTITLVTFWLTIAYHIGKFLWRLNKAQSELGELVIAVGAFVLFVMGAVMLIRSLTMRQQSAFINNMETTAATAAATEDDSSAFSALYSHGKLMEKKTETTEAKITATVQEAPTQSIKTETTEAKITATMQEAPTQSIKDQPKVEPDLAISDDEGREMFSLFRLYAMSSEMKMPLQLFFFIKDLILGYIKDCA